MPSAVARNGAFAGHVGRRLGPERSVAEARKALGRAKIDLALLDIRLGSETVFPIS